MNRSILPLLVLGLVAANSVCACGFQHDSQR
jgi:hypothetical protein